MAIDVGINSVSVLRRDAISDLLHFERREDYCTTMQKEELEQRCAGLRQKLKVWEAAFAQSHEGQKPSQDDVKQDEKIGAS